ncbi:MAG: YrhK family protein [Alphaproteobacteria bacterium]|nr:YrhK family protein [Alphaproteobacteria bacterium]
MRMFDPKIRTRTHSNARLFALYEIVYTLVDFAAAFLFIFGSILFFDDTTVAFGTWLFLIGSVCFALKPTIRLVREIHYYRIGQIEELARRAEG